MMNTTRSILGRVSSFSMGRGRLLASLLFGTSYNRHVWCQNQHGYGCDGLYCYVASNECMNSGDGKDSHDYKLQAWPQDTKLCTMYNM